jgi:hypothetical protein
MRFMTIKTGFAFPQESGKPSSGDGASVESAYDPSTGAKIPGYKAPKPSAQQDTSGANGGLGHSDTGQADLASYRAAQRQYGTFDGDGSGGTTIK